MKKQRDIFAEKAMSILLQQYKSDDDRTLKNEFENDDIWDYCMGDIDANYKQFKKIQKDSHYFSHVLANIDSISELSFMIADSMIEKRKKYIIRLFFRNLIYNIKQYFTKKGVE